MSAPQPGGARAVAAMTVLAELVGFDEAELVLARGAGDGTPWLASRLAADRWIEAPLTSQGWARLRAGAPIADVFTRGHAAREVVRVGEDHDFTCHGLAGYYLALPEGTARPLTVVPESMLPEPYAGLPRDVREATPADLAPVGKRPGLDGVPHACAGSDAHRFGEWGGLLAWSNNCEHCGAEAPGRPSMPDEGVILLPQFADPSPAWVTEALGIWRAPLGPVDFRRLASEHQVTHLLDVQDRIVRAQETAVGCEIVGLRGLHLPADDDGQNQAPEWFAKGVAFARDSLASLREDTGPRPSPRRLVVTCEAGLNRSASMAYAVLRAAGWDAADARERVEAVRSGARVRYQDDAEAWLRRAPAAR